MPLIVLYGTPKGTLEFIFFYFIVFPLGLGDMAEKYKPFISVSINKY